ncbi:SNF2 helicase associated domain-containing protein [Gordoniibacillus kamchatkensis]|uniref:SNF2 helicase associated domain-containing protein n=1 Tax=Gordoniibacillus kamchatkensis TaxID=1590651 RepID=UPI000B31268C
MQLTKKAIKQRCGTYTYQIGERLSRANKVRFTRFDPENNEYAAEVKGSASCEVRLAFDHDGEAVAKCSCPTLGSFDSFCQHIAAVLIRLHDIQQNGGLQAPPVIAASQPKETAADRTDDTRIAERILGLFDDKPVRPIHNKTLAETRTALEAEFILKLLAYPNNTFIFGIELKVGPKSVYVVRNLASFLDQLARGESYPVTASFSYDPETHSFAKENEAVLRVLIDMVRDTAQYRAAQRMVPAIASGTSGDRMLPIPPQAWAAMLPLLMKAPRVTIMDGDNKYDGLQLSDGPLPLRFEFEQEEGADTCRLRAHGLEQIAVMEPYGIVFTNGKLVRLAAKPCKRLAELKAILETSDRRDIPVPHEQIGTFMEKVVPGLAKLGSVDIAPAIAERVTQAPLQAKLYLDRVKDRLLAAVEFQYGDEVINPLEDSRSQRDAHRILVRDHERERRIIDLIEQSPFTKTEAGYFMNEEEAEFDFLHNVVPQLEPLMKIYATSAVKVRLLKGHALPKASVHVAAAERIDWLEFRLNMDWIPETEIRQIVKSLEEKRKYYRLPNGSLLPLDIAELQEMAQLLAELGLTYEDVTGSTISVPLFRGLHLTDREYRGVKLDKPVRQLLDNLRNPDNLDFPIPDRLADVLRDYQKLGYQWLKTLAHYGFGGILADEMGLGKTLQSIAFIASVLPEIRQRRTPALVVSPGSLVYNWLSELRKFAPDIRAVIADGNRTERARKLRGLAERRRHHFVSALAAGCGPVRSAIVPHALPG